MNVRTIGTNRASTSARGPYFSKKACVSSMYFGFRNRAFGLVNSVVPSTLPM
jgi:hypothetical protein